MFTCLSVVHLLDTSEPRRGFKPLPLLLLVFKLNSFKMGVRIGVGCYLSFGMHKSTHYLIRSGKTRTVFCGTIIIIFNHTHISERYCGLVVVISLTSITNVINLL